MIYQLGDQTPSVAEDAYVAPSADVAGSVILGAQSSVWFGAVLRGDNDQIVVGARTNIQDNTVIHVDAGIPTIIGSDVSVGHSTVIHGCTIADNSLIGNGAVILGFAQIGENSLVGAGALVTEGKIFPPRSLILGSPARPVRDLTDEELQLLRDNIQGYIDKARRYRTDLHQIG
ncbi:MAG: gamma carbonic anhydrase family protein [Acidiferrobacteraceae bacterium]|jgi:carbonic anhydrase/acetyltransferase-like protein (isoleucine patch superfamily)|nr:gamma carbonic anhydrase family protein [Acidiferrobacteraceae bacterium]MCP4827981.1 gamma carbonic anhydrase family protein [Pseudomonadota bacterium]MDP6950398.1 gamma carbonic anhydrase family protein [Arenicellales bacterium]HJP06526.1 gamma carbonic anhydrase family protein [Arenicellales bacterium]|tara:strand:- start:7753 stop:8274 length:522 start_codon:yes stop_codon:yes gene_type:complete